MKINRRVTAFGPYCGTPVTTPAAALTHKEATIMMTQNGISTTTALGQEQYDTFTRRISGKTKKYFQYDYRHANGELFSCIKPTLEACRAARDAWLNKFAE